MKAFLILIVFMQLGFSRTESVSIKDGASKALDVSVLTINEAKSFNNAMTDFKELSAKLKNVTDKFLPNSFPYLNLLDIIYSNPDVITLKENLDETITDKLIFWTTTQREKCTILFNKKLQLIVQDLNVTMKTMEDSLKDIMLESREMFKSTKKSLDQIESEINEKFSETPAYCASGYRKCNVTDEQRQEIEKDMEFIESVLVHLGEIRGLFKDRVESKLKALLIKPVNKCLDE